MGVVAFLLSCVAALIATAVLAVGLARSPSVTRIVYGVTLIVSLAATIASLIAFIGHAAPSGVTLPIGLPWLGAHFRVDVLAAFFLVVVDLGAAARQPLRPGLWRARRSTAARPAVLPRLPGRDEPRCPRRRRLQLSSCRGSSCRWPPGRWSWRTTTTPRIARRASVYLVMASFGTLALLLAFGLLAGPSGDYGFSAMRARGARPAYGRACAHPCPGRRRLQGGTCAAARLAAACPSRGAEPCIGADERRDDQSRRLWLHSHRVRSRRAAAMVVGHARACRRRRQRGARRPAGADAGRPQAAARLFDHREYRHRLRRPRPGYGLPGRRHGDGGSAGADRRAVPRAQPFLRSRASYSSAPARC